MSGHILPYRGLWPKIHPDAFIADTATVIGDVEIGPGSSIWFGCILRGDVNRIRVGAGSNLQDGTVVHGNHDRAGDYRETGGGMPTVIGDNVVVGHQAMLHACTLEDGAFVGRSEEHTSELQALMRISSAVFCLNKTQPLISSSNSQT